MNCSGTPSRKAPLEDENRRFRSFTRFALSFHALRVAPYSSASDIPYLRGDRTEWSEVMQRRSGDQRQGAGELPAVDPRPAIPMPGGGNAGHLIYEILSPHVEEILVAGIGKSRGREGQKTHGLDAFRRAEELRAGTIEKRVFKALRLYSRLREFVRVHSM